jgi:hypothetical protein
MMIACERRPAANSPSHLCSVDCGCMCRTQQLKPPAHKDLAPAAQNNRH